jgi:hypothetical protein
MTFILPGGLGILKPAGGSAFDPAQTGSYATLSNNNLTVTGNDVSNSSNSRGTRGRMTGTRYFEMTAVSWTFATTEALGLCNANFVIGGYAVGGDAAGNSAGIRFLSSGTYLYATGYGIKTSPSGGNQGSVVGVAVDLTNGFLYTALDSVWLNGSGPGAAADWTFTTGINWYPAATVQSSSTVITLNVGATPFRYALPPGYVAWG